MGPSDVNNAFETIKSIWEKKKGIAITSISFTILYFTIAKSIDVNYSIDKVYNLSLPIILLIIFLYWLISTHRILIKDPDILGIYVCISCEENFESNAKRLFSSLIEELGRDSLLNIIYVRLLPLNKFKTQTEMETWLGKQRGDSNAVIFLNIKNGNTNSEEKINIDSISYSGFFKNNNLSIEGENLNISQDISLRLSNKDWSYFEKNSLDDKDKLRNNLKDLIIYYGGLFYLNESQFEHSRILLKYLYNPSLSIVEGKLDKNNNQINLEVKPVNIQAGRLNYLLTHIYLKCILQRFDSNNPNESIILLNEVETFYTPQNIKLIIYMNSAYMYFIVGKIEQSKIYTNKIHDINPRSFAFAINMGFYAIIENNPIDLAKFYSSIDENGLLDTQPLDAIGFLADYQMKYPNSKLLFEVAIAILMKLFIEEVDGNNKLKIVIEKIPSGANFKLIKKLSEKTLKQKWPKKIQRQRHKVKKTTA
jgi:hypothetical protein